jgi:hypothetical protein
VNPSIRSHSPPRVSTSRAGVWLDNYTYGMLVMEYTSRASRVRGTYSRLHGILRSHGWRRVFRPTLFLSLISRILYSSVGARLLLLLHNSRHSEALILKLRSTESNHIIPFHAKSVLLGFEALKK